MYAPEGKSPGALYSPPRHADRAALFGSTTNASAAPAPKTSPESSASAKPPNSPSLALHEREKILIPERSAKGAEPKDLQFLFELNRIRVPHVLRGNGISKSAPSVTVRNRPSRPSRRHRHQRRQSTRVPNTTNILVRPPRGRSPVIALDLARPEPSLRRLRLRLRRRRTIGRPDRNGPHPEPVAEPGLRFSLTEDIIDFDIVFALDIVPAAGRRSA